MRVRITFAKTEAMRFTSHLDLYRTWERTMRRAKLPLAYSQGFRPHPRINLASALPLGFTSGDEIVDIWLEQELDLNEIQAAVQQAAPPGIRIIQIEEVETHVPTLQAQLESSEFTITFLDPLPDLDARLEQLLSSDSLRRERRGKSYDLRQLIQNIQRLPDDNQGRQRLRVQLIAQEGATGRPEEIILTLGGNPEAARVHREKLVFKQLKVED